MSWQDSRSGRGWLRAGAGRAGGAFASNRSGRWIGAALLLLASWLAACGGAEWDGLTLSIHFAPEDLPAGTAIIRVYVLPSVAINQAQQEIEIKCEDLVGPTATKTIMDYRLYQLRMENVLFDAASGGTVVLQKLSEGKLVFYVEAMDSVQRVLAYGCGTGNIEKGKKTYIPIRMVAK